LSKDGRLLYTAAPLTIHDLVSGSSATVRGTEGVGRLAVSPDGRLLAGPDMGGLVLLDAGTGQVRRRLRGTGAGGWMPSFSPDGSRVATVTSDREAVVWDVATGDVLNRLQLGEGGEAVDFSADGSTLYTAGSNTALRHWDLDGHRRFIRQVAVAPSDLGDYSFVQPAPGGALIAYPNVSGDGAPTVHPAASHVTFLDVRSGDVSPSLDRGRGYRPVNGEGSWHPDRIHYALATGAEIRVWNAATGRLTTQGRPSGPYISAVDYSTDGSRLAMAELSGRLTMLDPATMQTVGRPVQLDESICCVSAGPDNRTVLALTGALDPAGFWWGSISHWALVDLESGAVLDRGALGLDGTRVAFSPTGRHAAIGGKDGQVLVLNTQTGEAVRPPVAGHVGYVQSLTYSPDGERFLTSGVDGTVGLWDGSAGELLARVQIPQRPISAEFGAHPDTVMIATLTGGPIYTWDTSVDQALAFACRVADRDFTKAEWQDHFADRPYQETCPS
jgi:WD40 repeat protein